MSSYSLCLPMMYTSSLREFRQDTRLGNLVARWLRRREKSLNVLYWCPLPFLSIATHPPEYPCQMREEKKIIENSDNHKLTKLSLDVNFLVSKIKHKVKRVKRKNDEDHTEGEWLSIRIVGCTIIHLFFQEILPYSFVCCGKFVYLRK